MPGVVKNKKSQKPVGSKAAKAEFTKDDAKADKFDQYGKKHKFDYPEKV